MAVVLVELDVFSGRPNPRWELDEPTTAELQRILSGLSPATNAAPEPPGLGYRGVVFTDDVGHSRAYRNRVSTPRLILADPTVSVERFLLDQIPEEFAAIGRRIRGLGQEG